MLGTGTTNAKSRRSSSLSAALLTISGLHISSSSSPSSSSGAAAHQTEGAALNATHHPQMETPKLPVARKALKKLPLEIWVTILAFLDIEALLKVRFLEKKVWLPLANELLETRLNSRFLKLCVDARHAELELERSLEVNTPHLDHFRTFLAHPLTTEHLTEVIWYSNAPVEVQVVCECLLRLKGEIDLPDNVRLSWPDIKRMMKRVDFKFWLNNLSTSIDFVDILDTRKVEQIIRVDPLITYERLRDVSQAGYRLLVFVAGSLQYSSHANIISESKVKCQKLSLKLESSSKFMDAVKGNL